MTRSSRGIVVVGASAAGLATVEGLRRGGYGGPLTLVGSEPHLPYDRPPMSRTPWDQARKSFPVSV
ncbi:FAD-dependent oxidoreductase [Streptomyces sp. NPDC048248]|uniref:FAD-dependent oxidoreductase n=1 Tax=Streptomyces sp. NPDC048248 TaxID=3365523 RepID=UPI00371687D8